jgi:hypothetical protein
MLFVVWGCGHQSNTVEPDIGEVDADQTPDSDESTESVAWSADVDCIVCHTAQSTNNSTSGSTHVFENHTTCENCHSDPQLDEAHQDATSLSTMPVRLKKTKVLEEGCLVSGCHIKDELPAKTSDLTALTDANGLVANPHDVSECIEHESMVCANCHIMHKESTIEEAAMGMCVGCHHKKVWECGTCH